MITYSVAPTPFEPAVRYRLWPMEPAASAPTFPDPPSLGTGIRGRHARESMSTMSEGAHEPRPASAPRTAGTYPTRRRFKRDRHARWLRAAVMGLAATVAFGLFVMVVEAREESLSEHSRDR